MRLPRAIALAAVAFRSPECGPAQDDGVAGGDGEAGEHRRRDVTVNSPDEFTAMIRSEVGRWHKLARDTNLKVD